LRALLLDGHSAAAIESLQSLGRRGVEVDVATEHADCLAFRSVYLAQRLEQPPPLPLEPALAWLHKLDAERNYDLIVATTETSLLLLRALDEADACRMKAALPGNAALDCALDKQATLSMARDLGIPVPRSEIIPRGGPAPRCTAYPVVLKATRSRVVVEGGQRRLEVVIARDRFERARILSAWLPYTSVQQQEFIAGHGFGIEMLFERGVLRWHFAHERLHELPLTGGGSSYRRSIAAPAEMLEAAARILRALRWHGVAMVEFRSPHPRGFHLMEINPRLWGSLALPIDCGVDFPWSLALLATGRAVPPQPRYARRYYTRHLENDIAWQVQNFRASRSDPLLLTRSRMLAALQFLRPLLGCESLDHFDLHDRAVIAGMLQRALGEPAKRNLARLGSLWRKSAGRA
jgi:hypothetical protein